MQALLKQVRSNKDASEVRDYDRFVREICQICQIDLSDLSDFVFQWFYVISTWFPRFKKNARRTDHGQTDRRTNGRTDPLIEMRRRIKKPRFSPQCSHWECLHWAKKPTRVFLSMQILSTRSYWSRSICFRFLFCLANSFIISVRQGGSEQWRWIGTPA